MRRARPLTLAALALSGLAACHPAPLSARFKSVGVHVQTVEPTDAALAVADRLDCPAEVGLLRRVGAAADTGCDYESEKGRVHLALLDNPGDPKAAVAPLRAELDSELPGVAQKATVQVVSEKDAYGRKVDKVDLPFLHVEDDGSGRSRVRMLGFSIDDHDSHHHRHAPALNAHDDDGDDDDGDEAPAHASTTPPEKRGVELVYVLVSGAASAQGDHAVGYIAKGPPKGRLVVATFRYKTDKTFNQNNHDDSDIDRLMALNVKPA